MTKIEFTRNGGWGAQNGFICAKNVCSFCSLVNRCLFSLNIRCVVMCLRDRCVQSNLNLIKIDVIGILFWSWNQVPKLCRDIWTKRKNDFFYINIIISGRDIGKLIIFFNNQIWLEMRRKNKLKTPYTNTHTTTSIITTTTKKIVKTRI